MRVRMYLTNSKRTRRNYPFQMSHNYFMPLSSSLQFQLDKAFLPTSHHNYSVVGLLCSALEADAFLKQVKKSNRFLLKLTCEKCFRTQMKGDRAMQSFYYEQLISPCTCFTGASWTFERKWARQHETVLRSCY